MLLKALLLALSSHCVCGRKSEPQLDESHAGLFRGSDRYDFALVVGAAETECFWHFAHQSGSFYLTYMVSSNRGGGSPGLEGLGGAPLGYRVLGGLMLLMHRCAMIAQRGPFLWAIRLITPTFRVRATFKRVIAIAVNKPKEQVQWVTGMANDQRMFVTVSSPQGALVASENEAFGRVGFQTEVTGFYKLCLGNHNNQFGGIRVFVNFGVIYDGSEELRREKEEGERVLNSTLVGIEESVQRLQNHILDTWRHYIFARMRKGKDHYLLQSNLNYVTWWSATQSLLILLSGYLQLFVLKRLFRTDASRPRC